jgi:hypothetical protein
MRTFILGLALVLSATACRTPNPASGSIFCGPGESCPTGYECIAGACWRPGEGPDLANLQADMSPLLPDLTGVDLSGQPFLIPDVAAHNFQVVPLAASATVTVRFSNIGGLATETVTTSLTNTPLFQLVTDGCTGKVLGSGMDCSATVRFSPQTSGDFEATLKLSAGMLSASVALSGSGRLFHNLQINISKIAGGDGQVQVNPSGASCGSGCFAFQEGAQVDLTALVGAGSAIGRWANDCAGSGSTLACSLTMTGARTASVAFRPTKNIVFVTSQGIVLGSLGGDLAIADQHCRDRASEAMLGGTVWRAALAKSGESLFARLSGAGSGGWIRPDGRPVAADLNSLQMARLWYPPRLDEFGRTPPGTGLAHSPATGAQADGTVSNNCAGYTVAMAGESLAAGDSQSEGSSWVSASYRFGGCAAAWPFYCFQLDYPGQIAAPPLPPTGARIAFLSTGNMMPGTGVGAGDAICAAEATSAGLAGQFLALLPPAAGMSAFDRFDLGGQPWYRRDGVQVVGVAGDLSSEARLAGVDRRTDGTAAPDATLVWTGTGVATPTACDYWTKMTGVTGVGRPSNAGDQFLAATESFSLATRACSTPLPVYCFQK